MKKDGTVMYFCFWGLDDPLTRSTVLPAVELLVELGYEQVELVTIERDDIPTGVDLPSGVHHSPWRASKFPFKPVARAIDLVGLALRSWRRTLKKRPAFIISRSDLAGAIAHAVHVLSGIPYVVESFEPHADYEVDVGVWKANGIMARSTRFLHRMQEKHAFRLLPVSNNYAQVLRAKGVADERILVVPCPVDLDRFQWDPAERQRIREELGVHDRVVGVYAGKFGGLYCREEAFRAFAGAYRFFGGKYHQLILTPEDPEVVLRLAVEAGLPPSALTVEFVPHAEVPQRLLAADLAFATYRPTPSSAYLSPIKIGEYWACGLPVLLTKGVGDEHRILQENSFAGALFDPSGDDLGQALRSMLPTLKDPTKRRSIRDLAENHRSFAITRSAYASLINDLSGETTERIASP